VWYEGPLGENSGLGCTLDPVIHFARPRLDKDGNAIRRLVSTADFTVAMEGTILLHCNAEPSYRTGPCVDGEELHIPEQLLLNGGHYTAYCAATGSDGKTVEVGQDPTIGAQALNISKTFASISFHAIQADRSTADTDEGAAFAALWPLVGAALVAIGSVAAMLYAWQARTPQWKRPGWQIRDQESGDHELMAPSGLLATESAPPHGSAWTQLSGGPF